MIKVRKSAERGRTEIDWLKSFHSFSFGEYFDPENIHFGPLRVLNDDTVLPGAGFPMHPHKEMEIVTIVTHGELTHQDSMGNKEVIHAGAVQRMTAGTGVRHSEFNDSDFEEVTLLQIWLIPNKQGLTPSYQQIKYEPSDSKNKLLKLVSGNPAEGLIFINQDADIYRSNLEQDHTIDFKIREKRGIYIFVISGILEVNGKGLFMGDAAEISGESQLNITGKDHTDFILFDLSMQ